MLEAVTHGPRFNISLKRSTYNLRLSISSLADYPIYRQLPSFVIESDRQLHINLDGEPVLDTRFAFETVQGALMMALG